MFFENDMLLVNVLDVIELKQDNISMINTGRNFSALSFRLRSDTVIRTENNSYNLRDNYVTYFPARLEYSRNSLVDELIVIHFDTNYYSKGNIECFMTKKPEKFRELFYRILELWNKKDVGYKYKCAAVFYEILAECQMENFKLSFENSKIKKSVDYIVKNYKQKDLSMKKIAEKSYMSEVYFRKLFKEEFGISPKKYIIKLRIQNALYLISTGYYSLKEVSDMSGYEDYKHFSVEFKKIIGISPSKYRYRFDG